MNSQILNRDFQHPSDGWYHIEALGRHPNHAAGVEQVIDRSAVEAIVKKFNDDAAAGRLRHGNEMLIDHEHFSDQADQETRAYGWLQELQHREDGIYGRVRWSRTGRAAVDGGDYRFFSTEYDRHDLEELKSEGRRPKSEIQGPKAEDRKSNSESNLKPVRPLRLAGLTLTNMNNNRGQKPITNRAGAPASVFAGSGETAENQAKTRKNKMKNVIKALGLADEANEENILAAVTRLQNRAGELEPLGAENTKLKSRLAELEAEQSDALLDACGVKEDKVRNRLRDGMMLLTNREERLAYLSDFGYAPGKSHAQDARTTAVAATRVLNRGTGAARPVDNGNLDERALTNKIRNRASELKGAGPGRTFNDCWQQAQREALALRN